MSGGRRNVPTLPVPLLRDAVARETARLSLRQAAAQISLSPNGLRNFLNGSAPRSATRAKLERWLSSQQRVTRPPNIGQLVRLLDELSGDLSPQQTMRLGREIAGLLAAVTLLLPASAIAAAPGDADVAALQVGLTALGLYHGDIDGLVGNETLTALRGLPGATTPLAPATRAALGDFGAHPLGSRPLVPRTGMSASLKAGAASSTALCSSSLSKPP